MNYLLLFTLTILLFFISKTEGLKENHPKRQLIVGGTPAPFGKYPSSVLLYVNGFMYCGGSLIHPDVVLTAASCVTGAYAITAFVGGTNLDGSDSVVVDVEQLAVDIPNVVVHPAFSYTTQTDDIALVKLGVPVDADLQCMNLNPAVPTVGELATIIGFGTRDENDFLPSDALIEANVNIIDDVTCSRGINYVTSPATQICAGIPGGGVDFCGGDQGGPLLANGGTLQVGLASYGEGCARPGIYGVYTDISQYQAFIENGIAQLSSITYPQVCGPTSVDTPVTSTPVTAAPVTATPVASTPVTSVPVTLTPVTSVPVTQTPVTSVPVTSTPVTSVPVTSTPVASTPVTSTPVASTPVTSTPIASTPVTSAPVASAPIVSTPIAKPRIQKPTKKPAKKPTKKPRKNNQDSEDSQDEDEDEDEDD